VPLLRNADRAIIEPQKLRDNLLNPENPNNGGKWRVFFVLGYRPDDWEAPAGDLRTQHLTHEAEFSRAAVHGDRFTVTAIPRSPRGSANIESVWQFDTGSEVARLISAY
jgi:hypothetical protein